MRSRVAWGLLLAVLPTYAALGQTIEYFDAPVVPESPGSEFDRHLQSPGRPSRRGVRTLILFDGRRQVQTTTGDSVDLSFIPSILISRMETVTGGASAVYGSAATTGRARPPPQLSAPLEKEAIVAAPVANVWRAWTTSAGLSAWLAPLAAIDLRIGGSLRLSHDGRGVESDTAVVHEILALDPQRMLALRATKAPRDFLTAGGPSTWTVVYLEPVGTTATRVRVVVNGLAASATEGREYFDRRNAETLQRLVQRFGNPGDNDKEDAP